MKKILINHSRKIIFGLCLIPCLLSYVSAGDQNRCDIISTSKSAPAICGVAQQGGMIYGESIGWTVYVGDLKISNNGVFVYGLDRDAPDTLRLKFCAESSGTCQTYSYPIAARKYLEQKVSVPDKFITYPDDVEKRINSESAEIKTARAQSLSDTSVYFMNMTMPSNLAKYKISGVYGSRRVFNGVPKSPHRGLDFAAPTGTNVYPIAPGRVILAAEHYLNGNIVMVSHGHGIVSAYLHLSEIKAKVGDSVDGNAVIGKVGSTGRSSGAHLHLGLYWRDAAIDPGLFILNQVGQNVRN